MSARRISDFTDSLIRTRGHKHAFPEKTGATPVAALYDERQPALDEILKVFPAGAGEFRHLALRDQ